MNKVGKNLIAELANAANTGGGGPEQQQQQQINAAAAAAAAAAAVAAAAAAAGAAGGGGVGANNNNENHPAAACYQQQQQANANPNQQQQQQQNEECDRYSFDDSDRFEEDSLCSWSSEPESLCNNWRGWKRPIANGAYGSQMKRCSEGEFMQYFLLCSHFLCPLPHLCVCVRAILL